MDTKKGDHNVAGSKTGDKAPAGSHGSSQQSSSDKEAAALTKKCGPNQ